MCLWGLLWKSPRFHGVIERNRRKSKKGESHPRNFLPEDDQRSAIPHRKGGSPQQIRLQSNKQMPSFLQDLKVGFRLDRQVWSSIPGAKALPEQPPLLSPSKEGEDLFLYLAMSTTVVSTSHDHRSKGLKFCMEKYCMQVRDPTNNHLG